MSSYAGWRWIFIVEGAITIAAAIAAYFIVVDFPGSKSNRFLTEEERAFVQARLIQDRGSEDEHAKINAAIILHTMIDWKIWSFSLMYFAGARYVNVIDPLIRTYGELTETTVAYTLSHSFFLSSFARGWGILSNCHLSCQLSRPASPSLWSWLSLGLLTSITYGVCRSSAKVSSASSDYV